MAASRRSGAESWGWWMWFADPHGSALMTETIPKSFGLEAATQGSPDEKMSSALKPSQTQRALLITK